jgi:hypothetical protein
VGPLGPFWLLKYSREPSGLKAGPQISEPPRVICISSLAGWPLMTTANRIAVPSSATSTSPVRAPTIRLST